MGRSIKFTSQITVLLLFMVLCKEAVSLPGWEQTSPDTFCELADELQPALRSFLGRNVVVDKIVFSIDNCCDVADYHPYLIFARIEDQSQKPYYWINAYIGFSGDLTVTSAEQKIPVD